MKKGLKTNLLFFICGLLFIGVFSVYSIFIAKPTRAATGINQTINFQGRLLNSQGATVPDGFYNIQFKIYQDGDGQSVGNATGSPAGSLKWTESYLNNNSQGVKVINGYLSVQLGSVTAFGSNIDWNQSTLWLSMNIGGAGPTCTPFSSCSPDGEMVPMQPLTSAPYAFNSGALNGLTSAQFVQLAQGLQTDASSVAAISINKTGSGDILDLQAGGNSVFVLSNTGAATFTSNTTGALLVRDTTGTGYLGVDTSTGTVKIGVTGITSANSTIHLADSSSGIQTVTIGSTNSSSATTIKAGSGGISLNGDTTIAANKNFTQSGTGTFSTGSGTNSLNGDTTIAANKNFTQSGTGTFSSGSGTNTLNGNTTVAGTNTFAVNGGNTTLGANLDVTSSTALKKGTDFSTTGTTNNASFANASLIRLTGSSAQTITGIAGGRDGYVLTLVNTGSNAAVLTNNDSNSSAANRITTGTGGSVSLPVGASVTLVYDSGASMWRAGATGGNTLQSDYNNSVSPQITLSSANGGLVVQDASSAIGTDLFTVQSNGGATKYLNVTATTVAINDNLTVSGTYNTNTFNSTTLQFGGASGNISTSTGNLTIQASSSNSLILDTAGSGTVSLAGANATTVNIATSNVAHNIHIGDGGTSTAQTIAIGSSGAAASTLTLNAGSSGGINANGSITINGNATISGTNSFATGSGAVSLNGDTTIAANKNFTQSGTGTFSTGSGTNSLNGDTTIAANKNFTQSGSGTFSTGTGTNTLNGDTTVAGTKNFTVNGGNTTLGASLDVTGSTALKKGTDFSTTGTTNNASFSNASLIRLTGATAQTITGISGGRDGYVLTLINAGANSATLTNNDSNSTATNRIITGTGGSISLQAGATLTLVYDSTAAVWRADSANGTNFQTAYNNSTTSPQITLSSANGGLVVQDASSAIGTDLFTVQSNGGAIKYLNVTATTVAINDNLTVSGTYNTNTFNSTTLQFGGASGNISSSAGNLTIQASSSNSLILDTAGAGTVSLAGGNATTVNIATNNTAHGIHIGDGGSSTVQTITIGSTGSASSALTLNAGSSGGINANGSITINGNATISGTNAFATGSGAVSLNGDTTIAANKNFTQSGTGTFSTGSGTNSLNGDTTIAANKNFTQSGTGTFSTGSGTNSLNGDTTIAANKNFSQSGTGTFSSGSGTNTLNGDTTVAGTKNFTVNGGNTTLGASLDVTGSTALKKGTDFSATGTTNNASFSNASLIRLTGASLQTLTGIAGGRDGYVLTLVNAGSVAAVLNNNDSNSSAGNRIITGTGGNVNLPAGASVTLVYDSTTAVWRAGSAGGGTLQSAYNNSTTSPQITLSSANGGLVVQDASSALGTDLFTVQSNGGATKYFNVTATTVAINDNLTVSGTYNTNTFNSTTLQFGGASGTVSSSAGNLTIQAASTNSLILDTGGAGTVSLATGNAATVNIATNNIVHAINIGTGGTSTAQTIAIGSTGAVATSVTISAGSSGGITLNGNTAVSGANSFSTGTGSVALNGDTTVASGKNFTQSGAGTFSTGTGAVALNGDTTVASGKNFTQSGAGTFSTGTGTNSLNGNTTIASGKTFTALGDALFKDSANSASAFQVQNNSSFNVLAVDTSINHLKVYDGTATQAYVDIYYDDGTSSAVIAASTGTTKIGNGSGPIVLNAGAGSAVTITGHATSTWSLDSGNLNIDVTGAGQTLAIGGGANGKTINIGNGTGATSVAVTCGTGPCSFGGTGTDHTTTVGSTTGTSATAIQSGTGGVTITGNTTVAGANTFTTGTGAVALNGDTTVASGKNFTQSGAGTFSTGTGTNSLNGNTTVAAAKTFTANGVALFQSSVNSTTAFQIQNAAGNNNLELVDTTNGNLVDNASFETNTTNWAINTGSGSIATSTTSVMVGINSLAVNTSATTSAGAKYNTASLLSNTTTYALSFWARSGSGSFTVAAGRADNDTFAGETACTLSSTTITTTWTRYSCSFTTATVTAGGYVFIRQGDATARTPSFYLDGVMLETGATINDYYEGKFQFNGLVESPSLFKNQSDSTRAFQVQSSSSGTPIFDVDTVNNRIGINTATPGASLTVNSTVANTSGLQFSQLTNTSPVSSSFSQLLGLDSSGNVGLSSAGISLTSPALAYWDGLNNPTTGSQSYPLASLSGNASYVGGGNGVQLTPATNTQSGSINWNFSQVSFEETQFQMKAGGGTGADGTWFYSYADATPTTEYGTGLTKGYIIYFSEYHHCIGIAYGTYTDGNQCGSGGGTSPLTSTKVFNIGDNAFHNVDIQLRYNTIIVRWDGNVVLTYSDVYSRDLSSLNFGFGSRTGGSNNAHYIKGLLVTKLGTNTSQYNIDDISPLASNLNWDNANTRLGIGTAAPSSTLDIIGTSEVNGITSSAGTVYQGTGNATTCATTGPAGYTANTTVTGSGTAFASSMIGSTIILPDGVEDTISAVGSTTSLTVSGSRAVCPGSYKIITPILSTTSGGVQIGRDVTDTNQVDLQLDSYSSYTDTGTCSTTVNQGALYYSTNTTAIRSCIGGAWEDLVTTSGLGIITYGIISDSGPTPGDIAGVNGTDASDGPCKVYMGSVNNSVRWTGCTLYTHGRKQVVAAQTSDFTTGITTTSVAYQNLCIFTAGSAPSFGTASTTETSATLPTFTAASPPVCLATILEKTGGSGIGSIYDTRIFTTSTKQFATIATAVSPGYAVRSNGTLGQLAPTNATTNPFIGVVAAYSGTTQTTAINAVIVTHGPVYVKSTAGSVGAYIRPLATAGYVNTTALVTTAQTDIPYNYLGLSQTAFQPTAITAQCSITANADACRGSLLVDINIR